MSTYQTLSSFPNTTQPISSLQRQSSSAMLAFYLFAVQPLILNSFKQTLHICQCIRAMLLVVKIYDKIPPGKQSLPKLREIQAHFLVQPSSHHARPPARLDNLLCTQPAHLVKHLESQRGLGHCVRRPKKSGQNKAVFYRHPCPRALPGRGGLCGVAHHSDGAGEVCVGWRMLPQVPRRLLRLVAEQLREV